MRRNDLGCVAILLSLPTFWANDADPPPCTKHQVQPPPRCRFNAQMQGPGLDGGLQGKFLDGPLPRLPLMQRAFEQVRTANLCPCLSKEDRAPGSLRSGWASGSPAIRRGS